MFAANPPSTITQAGSRFIYSRQPFLTVQADSASRVYGNSNPVFGASITGLVNGDTESMALAGRLLSAQRPRPPRAWAAMRSRRASARWLAILGYGFSFVDGTLDVTQRGITVTADDLSRIYGNANPALTYRSADLAWSTGTRCLVHWRPWLTRPPTSAAMPSRRGRWLRHRTMR